MIFFHVRHQLTIIFASLKCMCSTRFFEIVLTSIEAHAPFSFDVLPTSIFSNSYCYWVRIRYMEVFNPTFVRAKKKVEIGSYKRERTQHNSTKKNQKSESIVCFRWEEIYSDDLKLPVFDLVVGAV